MPVLVRTGENLMGCMVNFFPVYAYGPACPVLFQIIWGSNQLFALVS